MIESYLLPVKTAATVFPLLALVLFLPSAVFLYRRHGVLSRWRALSLGGFLYFLLTAACLTLVPLPRKTPDFCERFAAVATPEWSPGHTFGDVWREAGDTVTVNTLVLQNPAVAGVLFNLLLLLPLGLFLRYHAHRGFVATVAIGFGASLFLEVTQGTGLWGVYPCPYRLFDVDDLLTNTAGVAVGWCLAGPLRRRLPSMATLDVQALNRRAVPIGRRLTALVVDVLSVTLLTMLGLALAVHEGPLSPDVILGMTMLIFVCWFVLAPWATGATPGKRLLRLELVNAAGRRPRLWRLLVRSVPYGVLLTLPLAFGALVGIELIAEPHALAALRDARGVGTRDASAFAFQLLVKERELLFALCLPAALMLLVAYLGVRGHHETLSGVRNRALPCGSDHRPTSSTHPAEPTIATDPAPSEADEVRLGDDEGSGRHLADREADRERVKVSNS